MVFTSILYAIQAAFFGVAIVEESFPEIEQPVGLTDILDAIGGFFLLIYNFATFNIPGLPDLVRWPLAVAVNGTLGWSIVATIRGVA